MIDDLDLELTVRIGALAPMVGDAILNHATAGMLWRGLGTRDALHLTCGLHWLAAGHREDCPSVDVVAALALKPLPDEDRARLALALDTLYAAGAARKRASRPPDPLGLDDRVMLGWRLSLALDLVDHEQFAAG